MGVGPSQQGDDCTGAGGQAVGCPLQELALGLLRTPALLCVNSHCSQPPSHMALVLLNAGQVSALQPLPFLGL